MDSKEKAIELVDKFMTGATKTGYNYKSEKITLYVLQFKQAKQCALICVDEKINLLNEIRDDNHSDEFWAIENALQKLYTVKQEIEKL